MQRRNFITGTVATATALAGYVFSDHVVAQPSLSTFADEDTLVQRVEKLNVLMGTSYEVDVTYPKEWDTGRHPVNRDELLGAQFPRLTYNPKHPFEWSVHLKLNGEQCTHDMTPLGFFHWTSQIAWDYRERMSR